MRARDACPRPFQGNCIETERTRVISPPIRPEIKHFSIFPSESAYLVFNFRRAICSYEIEGSEGFFIEIRRLSFKHFNHHNTQRPYIDLKI